MSSSPSQLAGYRILLAVLSLYAGLGATACTEPTGQLAEKRLSGPTVTGAEFSVAGYSYRPENAIQFKLPGTLREISGLTLDDAARLYAHDDERAIIYQIDYSAGRVLKRFALDGGLQGDFEGIAWLNGMLYLTTSSGKLHEFAIGAADTFVAYRVVADSLDCEVEGLSRLAEQSALLAACKNRPEGKRALHFHRWQPGDPNWSAAPALQLKRSQFDASFEQLDTERPKKFQPTALTHTPDGHLLAIAGPQKVLLEFSADGHPRAAARLNPDWHRQPEGIAMTADGTLIIADEGDGKGTNKSAGRLTIYRPTGRDEQ